MFVSKAAPRLLRRTAAPAASYGATRNLNVHEYISMEIMKSHGIATPECYVANNPDEVDHLFATSFNKRAYTANTFTCVVPSVASRSELFPPDVLLQ